MIKNDIFNKMMIKTVTKKFLQKNLNLKRKTITTQLKKFP